MTEVQPATASTVPPSQGASPSDISHIYSRIHSIIETVRDQPPKRTAAATSTTTTVFAERESDGVAVAKANRLAGEFLFLYGWYGLSTGMGLGKPRQKKPEKKVAGWQAGWLWWWREVNGTILIWRGQQGLQGFFWGSRGQSLDCSGGSKVTRQMLGTQRGWRGHGMVE